MSRVHQRPAGRLRHRHRGGGATLSGGERQRICIARALLKDAPIVILDEPTAAIDPTNECLLQQALGALIAGRTVLVIAHRLATIRSWHRSSDPLQGRLRLNPKWTAPNGQIAHFSITRHVVDFDHHFQ